METDNLGLNAVTIGFAGTVAMTLVRAWGTWRQGKKIWLERSGLSVPVPFYLYSVFIQWAVIIYGLSIGSLALLINGAVSFVVVIPVVAGLWRFKGFGKKDRLLCLLFSVGIAATLLVQDKGPAFLAWAVMAIGFSTLQPWEIWRNRDRGAVEIRTLLAGLVNSFFWLVYALAIDDWVLKLINPPFLAVGVISIVLWLRYRPAESPREPPSY